MNFAAVSLTECHSKDDRDDETLAEKRHIAVAATLRMT